MVGVSSGYSWGASCTPAKDASSIAVAGGSITELLYLLGEEERIIAADRTSNYPKEALELPSVGYVRNISAEGILSLKPTLVLGEHDMGPDEVIKQIENVSVEVIRVNEVHTASGIVDKLRCVASILGVNDKADALIENRIGNLMNQLDVVRNRSEFRARVALVLNFSDGAPIIAGKNTSGGGVIEMAGAKNVFESVDGWKPVSRETLVGASPDYIVITERALRAIGGLPGMEQDVALRLTPAVQNGRVHAVDGMALLGFGIRTLDAALKLSSIFD